MRHLIDTQIATVLSEGIPILSSDANFQRYRPAVQVVMNG